MFVLELLFTSAIIVLVLMFTYAVLKEVYKDFIK